MPVDPSSANGFGYAGWSFAPAIVFYERNAPAVAKTCIDNIGQDALNWLRKNGAPMGELMTIQSLTGCKNAAGGIRYWLNGHFPSADQTQNFLFDLGMGVGSARTHCMPDSTDVSQWPQEQGATIQGLLSARNAINWLPSLKKKFDKTIQDIINDLYTCAPFSNDIQGKRILPLLQSIPQAFLQSGP